MRYSIIFVALFGSALAAPVYISPLKASRLNIADCYQTSYVNSQQGDSIAKAPGSGNGATYSGNTNSAAGSAGGMLPAAGSGKSSGSNGRSSQSGGDDAYSGNTNSGAGLVSGIPSCEYDILA